MASSKREQLVETAQALFARFGYHATGIDRILENSGVAKMTLYKHFRSKEELILAALRRRDEVWRNELMQATAGAARPSQRVMALFETIARWCRDRDFCGCMFVKASAEFADPTDPIRSATAEHYRLLRQHVRDLLLDAGCRGAERVADQICLVLQGMVVMSQATGREEVVDAARDAVRCVLEQAGVRE